MSARWYSIEPKAPLVFRSAKPFGVGSRDGANFPWPSSIAGALRTQVMDRNGWSAGLSEQQQSELRLIEVAGPLLARRQHGRLSIHVPRPVDAVPLLDDGTSGQRSYHRLQPSRHPEGTGSDLPDGLLPLTFSASVKGKPQPAPSFWSLDDLLAWGRSESVPWREDSSTPWENERRTHVAIDHESLAADTGRLFQTEGIDLGRKRSHHTVQGGGFDAHDWVLLAATSERLPAGLITLGGERRLSWFSEAGESAPVQPPSLPATLADGFALTLVTPAIFSLGWRPGWLDSNLEGEIPGIAGLRVRLRAAAVERWQSISGWDIAKWQAKSTRKAVAAGSTYWFEVLDGNAEALSRLWFTCVSDGAQDRRDGFGLTIPRPWNATEFGDA